MGILNQEYLALKIGIKSYLDLRKRKDYLKWMINERGRLLQFKNIHQGEDCFVIGNGPSLNKMDLKALDDYYTFGMNKIFLIFKRVDLNLSYYVSVNPLVIEQSKGEIEKFNIPVFLSYNNTKDKIQSDNIYYLYTVGGSNSFRQDIANQIHESGTVTYIALQIAYYMGFKNVFLIGVDHNFTQDGTPNTIQKMEGPDLNHFDPDYFSGKDWHLADLKGSEYGYTSSKITYELNNRKIYDATVDGKLSIFEKLDFGEALKKARRKK